jgi:hypothetical protein
MRMLYHAAPSDVTVFPTVVGAARFDPVSSTLLEVNKALLSRLVKVFHSLWCHAFNARIRYANPDDFRHDLVHLGSSRLYWHLIPPENAND